MSQYDWLHRVRTTSNLEQLVQVAYGYADHTFGCDVLELNVQDISTGLFSPHRAYNPGLEEGLSEVLKAGYQLGQGLTGWLVEHRQPMVVTDARKQSFPRPHPDAEELPFRSYIGLPIQIDGELIATLEIAHMQAGKYAEAQLPELELLRDAVAETLGRLEIKQELRNLRLRSTLQEALIAQIKHLPDVERMVAGISLILKSHLDIKSFGILIYNPETFQLEPVAADGDEGRQPHVEFRSIPSPPDGALTSIWKAQDYWFENRADYEGDDAKADPLEALFDLQAERILMAPLVADSVRFGILLAGRDSSDSPFDENDGVLMHSIGLVCGPILQAAISRDPAQDRLADAAAGGDPTEQLHSRYAASLGQITGELASSMDLDHLLQRVLNLLRTEVNADQGAFLLTTPDTDRLMLRASSGSLPSPPPGGRPTAYQVDQGLAGWAISNRIAVRVDDLSADERWVPFDDESPRQQSALVAPLGVADEILGAILLLGDKKNAFSADDLELVKMVARQIAPAVHNAQLYHLIRDQAERLGLALRSRQVESSQSQAVLHAMADGVIATNPDHRIVVYNPAAEAILGRSQTEALGQPVFEVLEDLGTAGKEIGEQLRIWSDDRTEGQPRTIKPRRIETSRHRVLALQPAPIVLGDDYLGTVTIIRDITREVEVDRMKSDFVATVSHELRSPITPIKGFIDLLRMGVPGDLTGEQARFLEIIYQNIHRLEMLVDELLDISRIEAGKVALKFQALNVRQLIDELEVYIEHRCAEGGKQIDFHSKLDDDLPDIWGDSERVRQILTNIVDNSFDYTPDGGSIDVEAQQAREQIEIAVSDTGMGIAVDEQELIFERFYRGEQALIMGVAGAGLGLSIALTMVEMHGGRIWVNSAGTPGQGSTFTISLPIADPQSRPDEVVNQT